MQDQFHDKIGLVEFLTDLRAELNEAQSRAAGESLKLGVEEVTLSLDVAYTLSKGGDASADAKAKFWVLEFGAGAKGTASSVRARTQRLTLTFRPRTEEVVIHQEARRTPGLWGVDIIGGLSQG